MSPEKNPSAPPPLANSGCASLSERANRGAPPTPLFFVSVAAKGLSSAVSLLFATLAGRSISVAAKGLMRTKCWRESNWVGAEDSEGISFIGCVANFPHFSARPFVPQLTSGAPTALAAKEAQNTGLKTGHYMQGDAGLPDISRQDPHTGGKPGATTARVGLVRWLQRVSSFLRAWKFKLETRNLKLERN